MLCVALRHAGCEDLGTFGRVLAQRGWELRIVDVAAPEDVRHGELANLLIVLGGPMGVYDKDRVPFLQSEIELCAHRLETGHPVLGICLGAQILAAAAGARVFPSGRQEIGWYGVGLLPDGTHDPIAAPLAGIAFHWHGDTFSAPAGGTMLAASARFAAQAFRIGELSYGLQFHLEVEPGRLREWTSHYAAALRAPKEGVQSEAEILRGASEHGADLVARATQFMTRLLDQIEHAYQGAA